MRTWTLGTRRGLLTGLDIGSSSVKLAMLRQTKVGYRLVALGAIPLAAGAVVDGVVADVPAVAEAIRVGFRCLGVSGRHVATAVAGHGVVVKSLTLRSAGSRVSRMSEEELQRIIQWEKSVHVPPDDETARFCSRVVERGGESRADEGVALLVAARSACVESRLAALREAGCVPVVLDAEALALENAYELNYGPRPGCRDLLVNVGAARATLNIVADGVSLCSRDIDIGGHAYIEALQQALHLEVKDADRVTKGVCRDSLIVEDVRAVVGSVTDGLLREVLRTLDFLQATHGGKPGKPIDRVALSGGASRIDGLAAGFAEWFDTEVVALDPLRRVQIDGTVLTEEHVRELQPVTAVALGLALRRPGD